MICALSLRSTRFTITEDPSELRFDGRGLGRGLGIGQWGAYNLAQEVKPADFAPQVLPRH